MPTSTAAGVNQASYLRGEIDAGKTLAEVAYRQMWDKR